MLQTRVPSLPCARTQPTTREFLFQLALFSPCHNSKLMFIPSVMHFYHVSPANMFILYLGNKCLPRCKCAFPIRNYPSSGSLIACLHMGDEQRTMALTLLAIPGPLDSQDGFRCEEIATIGLGRLVCYTRSNTMLQYSNHIGRMIRPQNMSTSQLAFHTLISWSSLVVHLPSRYSAFHPLRPSPPARLRN